MTKTLTAIGLMSGTSMDGIDLALIETDGETVSAFGPTGFVPYTDGERALLRQALGDALTIDQRDQRPGAVAEAERLITIKHTDAVIGFLSREGIAPSAVDVIGFHGQTVLHRPEKRLTVQIGDGAELARTTGIPVVHDLRATDVAAGGQGAPLVPVYHRALVRALGGDGPVCFVNIGGVSNITYIDADDLIACDTGPGNALLDDFMLKATGEAVDRDGHTAANGTVNERWIAEAVENPFFAAPPPKSLDRNAFAALTLPDTSVSDGAATLTALTATALAKIVPLLPRAPKRWFVAGGGANNPTMMRMLAERVAPATAATAASIGWQGDAVEAQAFAFLAVRSLKQLPLTYPTTTGVATAISGGVLARP